MNRRNPTRIELKLDDLLEYDAAKKEFDEKNKGKDVAVNTINTDQSTSTTSSSGQVTAKSKQERIGLRMQHS